MPNLFLYGNTRPWTVSDSRASFPSMVLTVYKDDYKHSKEAFVSGMTGSTVSHVNMIALVALVCLHPLLLHAAVANDATTRPLLRYTLPSAHARHHRNPFCYFRNGYSSSSLCSSRRLSLLIAQALYPPSCFFPPRLYAFFSRHTSLVHLYPLVALPVHHPCPTARRVLITISPLSRTRGHPNRPRRRVCPR
jgi:hypothetical protein